MCSSFFENTKYTLMWINHFCMRCSVFENDESVNGLESRQFGGILLVLLLREKNNELNLEETDDSNELNWRNCDILWGISNNRRQTKFKHCLQLFNANCIWSRLSSTCSSPLERACKKRKLFFSMICLSHIFPPFWSAITAVCNDVSLFLQLSSAKLGSTFESTAELNYLGQPKLVLGSEHVKFDV